MSKVDDTNATPQAPETVECPERRAFINRLAKAGAVVPVATVIYNATTTVAVAY